MWVLFQNQPYVASRDNNIFWVTKFEILFAFGEGLQF